MKQTANAVAAVLLAVFLASAQETGNINKNLAVLEVGDGSGSNAIPFGGLPYQDRYQQFVYPWVWPSQKPAALKAIAFSSNPLGGSGVTNLNITVRVGVSDFLYPTADFNLNLPKGTVVFNGPISALLTGTPGDLRLQFMKPFQYNPRSGKSLVVDIEIHGFSGFTGSFRFGPSSDTGRAYRSPIDGQVVVDGAGLLLRLEFVPPDK